MALPEWPVLQLLEYKVGDPYHKEVAEDYQQGGDPAVEGASDHGGGDGEKKAEDQDCEVDTLQTSDLCAVGKKETGSVRNGVLEGEVVYTESVERGFFVFFG